MPVLKIYGSSDDLIEFESSDGKIREEFNYYDRDSEYIISGMGAELLYVKANFGRNGVWNFGVAPVEEDAPFPGWPITVRQGSEKLGENGYTAVVEFAFPDDVTLTIRDLHELKEDED